MNDFSSQLQFLKVLKVTFGKAEEVFPREIRAFLGRVRSDPSLLSLADLEWAFERGTETPVIGTDSIVYTSSNTTNNANVTQSVSGTQNTGQIPFWTGTLKELSKGSSGLFLKDLLSQ
jgi:hypothetical protein